MRNIIVLLLATLVLSGCSVHRVAGEIGGVDIEASRTGYQDHQRKHDYDRYRYRYDHNHYRGFCPPGQAKKGYCR
ncbi:hypothetical protein MAQ5080_02353 [Marinomonas aquimarina]|uniref:Type IV secretion system putative lipoprotein virB7 n=1 Tax=Marinomonas aquimarina TaxID=295068 RepID=A0A1A8TJP1_9GAMM|nr:membrane lipoprotein lipid attachment site-containing protein [Marinomonas aquimarina]SBS32774.1 hypothetical protein MAQ5080_02353 [Marinomonas aquimarina]